MKIPKIISRNKILILISILIGLLSGFTFFPFLAERERDSWYFEDTKADTVQHIAMSNDGKYIVTGGFGGRIYLFETTQSKPIWIYFGDNQIISITISSSGETIAAFTRAGELLIFNASSATPIWILTLGLLEYEHSLDISGDGNHILLITQNHSYIQSNLMFFNKNSPIPIWNVSTYPLYQMGVISEDGNYILAAQGNHLFLYDSLNFTEVWNYTGIDNVNVMSISSNGEYFIVSEYFSRDLYFFHNTNPNPIWNFTGYGIIYDFDISSSGNEITAIDDKYLYLFNKNSSIPQWNYEPNVYRFERVAISSDGNYIISGFSNLFLFNKSTPVPIWISNFPAGNQDVFISENGSFFGSSASNSFYMISRNNPQITSEFETYFLILFGIGYPSVIVLMSIIFFIKYRKKRELRRIAKFRKVISESDQIEIEEIYKLFKKDYDKKTFYRKILEWASEFKFTIDGETLLLKDGSVSEFIKLLDEMFLSWERDEGEAPHDKN